MTYLLDTHALLWSLQQPKMLGNAARAILANAAEHVILVSPVSAYEVSYKVQRGRWPEAARLAQFFDQALVDTGFQLVPLSIAAAVRAGRLSDAHRDPFDRLLAAVALEVDAGLISADSTLEIFGVRRIW